MTVPAGIAISEEEFVWFREYFGKTTGIYFEDNKRYFVDRRLEARMQATDHRSCRQYLAFVQSQTSRAELQNLINVMTVNETHFFREDYQLKTMVEQPALMSYFELSTEQRERIGMKDSLVRYAVGIEDTSELVADLTEALRVAEIPV